MTIPAHKTIASIQAFRAIAFIFIFLSHVPLIGTGPLGVSMFLILSGFLMSLSYENRINVLPERISECIKFGYKKTGKLYFLHLLTLILMVLYMAFSYRHGLTQIDIKNAIIAFPFQVAMLQAWLPNNALYFSFNKVSWFLTLCVFNYTIFPFLFRKIKKFDVRNLLLSAGGIITLQLIIAIMATLITGGDKEWVEWITYVCPVYRSFDFFLGVILGLVIQHRTENYMKKNSVMTLLEFLYFLILIIQIFFYTKGKIPNTIKKDIYWIPTSLMGVYLFYYKEGMLSKLLTNRVTVFLGNISGEAFLLHQMIIGFVSLLITNSWVVAICAMVITIIAAVIYKELKRRFMSPQISFRKKL